MNVVSVQGEASSSKVYSKVLTEITNKSLTQNQLISNARKYLVNPSIDKNKFSKPLKETGSGVWIKRYDEEIPGTKNHLGHEAKTINTRCTPSRWCRIVKKLSKERKQVVYVLRFGNLLALDCGCLRLKICRWLVDNFDTKSSSIDIHGRRFMLNSSVFARVLGISDLEDQISISGDVPNLDFWKSKFPISSRGIFVKDIEHSLKEMTMTDDEFKVTLCLFLLGTILSLSANDYAQTGYLIPLRDVGTISLKNWSIWCFSSLCEGIEKFQKNRSIMKTCCISECVLFLQANQRPVIGNHAHMKGIADDLQLVKEIQSTMKTELDDIRTKVNFLYNKFSSTEDKNLDNNLHNTSNHHKSMHNIPSNPTPPPPSSGPLSNPTSQHPTIEVSSNNTRTLPQHQQTISKSTPS
ncbi:hypothetical protein LWI28_011531 [Acer negundo]|uniref:Uncharacterized protein n=1 Tax=Acer negundo TaxID=4023 RepID=A0AAD5IRM4_ACENE|nr:hypothetical protein LWI28_011531 [Acer negundo]